MRVKNFGLSMPREMHDTQEWLFAIDAYDYDDPEPLALLFESGEEVPPAYKAIIADIIRGKRKPNKRAAAKLKLPARERLSIAAEVSLALGVIDALKAGVERMADRKAIETVEALRLCEEEAQNFINEYAEKYMVSTETIENILRDLRKKAENWPNV